MNWLRLDGFNVSDPRLVHGEHGQVVEVQVDCVPNKFDVPLCCLARKLTKNGTKTVLYRDLKIEAAPTWLHVARQRYTCQSCDSTLYQAVPHVDEDHYITSRLREAITLSAVKRTFADTVHVQGVEEKLAMRVFRSYADEQLIRYRFEAPRVLGIDENALMGSQRGVVCDVERGFLLDMYPGCTGSDVRKGFDRMDNWQNVEVWCQDMAGHYEGLAKDLFPKAAIVVDKFHLLKMANHWWGVVRRAETPKMPAEFKKKMPGMIRLFDKHWETMTRLQQDRVAEVLELSPRLKMAWTIKDSFYYFYEAPNREDAESAYTQWVQFAKADQHEVWKPLMMTVQRWRKEIFNYFDHPYTSGMVERMNRSIGEINRDANGMDFQTLRAKALLRYSELIPSWRFNMHFMQADSDWLDGLLDDDAADDDLYEGRYMVGSGFDPSTLIADLKAGLF